MEMSDPALSNTDSTILSFHGNSVSIKFKQKIPGLTGDYGTKAVQIMIPLKYLSTFWRTLEIPLINCGINLINLAWEFYYIYRCGE